MNSRIMMADRIIAGAEVVKVCANRESLLVQEDDMSGFLLRSPVIDCSNVRDYLFPMRSALSDLLPRTAVIRPPYSEMWMEAHTRFDGTFGAQVIEEELRFDDSLRDLELKTRGVTSDDLLEQMSALEHKRCVYIFPYFYLDNRIWSIAHKIIAPIGVNGTSSCEPFVVPRDDTSVEFLRSVSDKTQVLADASKVWSSIAGVTCLMALQFMNCKNVRVASNEPSPKLSKAHEKRHGKPLVRYHTIQIEPMKQVLETEGGIGHNGIKKALHICRGHFATYTDDKPLFGRVTGTFWKPAHVRGSLSEGAVVSDYKVNAPAK